MGTVTFTVCGDVTLLQRALEKGGLRGGEGEEGQNWKNKTDSRVSYYKIICLVTKLRIYYMARL